MSNEDASEREPWTVRGPLTGRAAGQSCYMGQNSPGHQLLGPEVGPQAAVENCIDDDVVRLQVLDEQGAVGATEGFTPSGRVGDCRAGLGRSLCSLLARRGLLILLLTGFREFDQRKLCDRIRQRAGDPIRRSVTRRAP
jgi:hypothetical protein